jgi:hypothetical protein
MAAKHERIVTLRLPESEMSNCLRDAAERLTREGWKLTSQSDGSYAFTVGTGLLSWGEKGTIYPDRNRVVVRSECSFPLQLIDWGKNRSNTEKVERLLQAYAERHA